MKKLTITVMVLAFSAAGASASGLNGEVSFENSLSPAALARVELPSEVRPVTPSILPLPRDPFSYLSECRIVDSALTGQPPIPESVQLLAGCMKQVSRQYKVAVEANILVAPWSVPGGAQGSSPSGISISVAGEIPAGNPVTDHLAYSLKIRNTQLFGHHARVFASMAAAQVTSAPEILKGYVAANDPSAGAPAKPVEWVAIPAGQFNMGTDSGETLLQDAKPVREVAIETFEMSKTAVTVEQYAQCVTLGGCTEPLSGGDHCNWGAPGRQLHPVNCVSWDQAVQYAGFMGARLPSESEWEYAATSGGRNQKYPWGNEEPGCDKAVLSGKSGDCARGTLPVCSKPAGNTAQGLCDMAGNVWQWVQDKYRSSYAGGAADGSAFEGAGEGSRVIRGGSFQDSGALTLRADNRASFAPDARVYTVGFRLARSR